MSGIALYFIPGPWKEKLRSLRVSTVSRASSSPSEALCSIDVRFRIQFNMRDISHLPFVYSYINVNGSFLANLNVTGPIPAIRHILLVLQIKYRSAWKGVYAVNLNNIVPDRQNLAATNRNQVGTCRRVGGENAPHRIVLIPLRMNLQHGPFFRCIIEVEPVDHCHM